MMHDPRRQAAEAARSYRLFAALRRPFGLLVGAALLMPAIRAQSTLAEDLAGRSFVSRDGIAGPDLTALVRDKGMHLEVNTVVTGPFRDEIDTEKFDELLRNRFVSGVRQALREAEWKGPDPFESETPGYLVRIRCEVVVSPDRTVAAAACWWELISFELAVPGQRGRYAEAALLNRLNTSYGHRVDPNGADTWKLLDEMLVHLEDDAKSSFQPGPEALLPAHEVVAGVRADVAKEDRFALLEGDDFTPITPRADVWRRGVRVEVDLDAFTEEMVALVRERDGFDAASIAARVRKRLRAKGIPVVDPESGLAAGADDGTAPLVARVHLRTFRTQNGWMNNLASLVGRIHLCEPVLVCSHDDALLHGGAALDQTSLILRFRHEGFGRDATELVETAVDDLVDLFAEYAASGRGK